MPVPFEALIPLGLVTAMFGITGSLLNLSRRYNNEGKPPRHSMDKWDKQMLERDKRLTGSSSHQSAEPVAPPGFNTSSIYYLTNKKL